MPTLLEDRSAYDPELEYSLFCDSLDHPLLPARPGDKPQRPRPEPQLPDWMNKTLWRLFMSMNYSEQTGKMSHPTGMIFSRALLAFETAWLILSNTYPLPNNMIPLWVPVESYMLFIARICSDELPPALRTACERLLTFDYDRTTQILTLHKLTKVSIATKNAFASTLYDAVTPFCLSNGAAGNAWRIFHGDFHPSFPNGRDERARPGGDRFAGWRQSRQPDAALFYRGPFQNPRYPDFVLEVGAGGAKMAALEERAKWYLETGKGETRMVLSVACGDAEWAMTLWKAGEGDVRPIATGGKSAEHGGLGGVGFPLRDVLPPMAVQALADSADEKTVEMLDRRIEITWQAFAKHIEVAWGDHNSEKQP